MSANDIAEKGTTMSITPDSFEAVPAEQGVTAEATPEDAITSESLPDTQAASDTGDTPEQAEAEVTPVRGPVPYERFEQIVRKNQALEAEQQTYAQLKDLYALAESDPRRAAEGFRLLSESLERLNQGNGPDFNAMTDTERALYQELQQVKQEVAQTRQGAQSTQDAVSARELNDSLKTMERKAAEKGWPFDADAVADAMDDLNLEKLVKAGKSMDDMVELAYKAAHFDKLPDAVRKQTYASQQKKAGAQLTPATSRGGQPTQKVSSVQDAFNVAMQKLGLPND